MSYKQPISITSSEHSLCGISLLGIASLYNDIGKQFETQHMIRVHSQTHVSIVSGFEALKKKEKKMKMKNKFFRMKFNTLGRPGLGHYIYF